MIGREEPPITEFLAASLERLCCAVRREWADGRSRRAEAGLFCEVSRGKGKTISSFSWPHPSQEGLRSSDRRLRQSRCKRSRPLSGDGWPCSTVVESEVEGSR